MSHYTVIQSILGSLSRPRKSQRREKKATYDYGTFEPRRVLASVFPAFINGQFTMGDSSSQLAYPAGQTFQLESNPAATKTIYLDFTGHSSYNNDWGHSIAFPRYDIDGNVSSYSDQELRHIQGIFQNVSEDYLPFNVNVTTKDPGVGKIIRSGSSDNSYGIRVVMTQPTQGFGNNVGGVSRLNLFGDNQDSPVFVFGKNANTGAIIASHEAGHSLGLRHDGYYGDTYHRGVGSGDTKWGPILGAPYGSNLTQWSNGNYAGATNSQDDVAIIRSKVGLRPDDVGNSFATAKSFYRSGEYMSEWGVVGTRSDVDMYKFTMGSSNLNLSVKPFDLNPNLDVLATLYDSSGNAVATQSPNGRLDANFNIQLPAGTYYLKVDGGGKAGAYDDYGSMGFYQISARAEPAQQSAVGESGVVSALNHGWQTVYLQNRYNDPVVVAGPVSYNGHDPTTVRVRNVTQSSFEIRIEEWNYLDQLHANESVSFMVVESGRHTLEDGSTIVAKNAYANSNFRTIGFGSQFNQAPVVLTQTVSQNQHSTVATRVRSVTRNNFEIRLQEQESYNRFRTNERIGVVAIEQGSSNASGMAIEAFQMSDRISSNPGNIQFRTNYGSTPVVFAGMQTSNGSNPAALRYTGVNDNAIQLFVEEEQSKDAETGHGFETVGYFAMRAGTLFATSSNQNSPYQYESPLQSDSPEENSYDVLDDVFADHEHEHSEFLPLDNHGHNRGLSELSLERLIEKVGHFA